MSNCLICKYDIRPFISFGRMPIANGFLSADQFQSEYFFELKTGYCERCSMVQLLEQPDARKMFHENYAFFSGTSERMKGHFREFAQNINTAYLKSPDSFVVEVGSNDGIMLEHFARAGVRHLGVEPSANVAKVARDKGVNTVCEFFNENLAKDIVKDHGHADAFLGANVMCHIANLNSVIAGIKTLLKPDGVVVFEDPYLGDVIEKTAYDQIYDEHVFLFSLSSIKYAFEQHDMELVDIVPQHTHGGSMRYVLAHKGARPVSMAVDEQLKKERTLGLGNLQTYETFRANCEKSRDALIALLTELKRQGKRVVGYAATSKSTTVINYCGLNGDLIEFISDTTPIKQGKFSPGMHIPVRPYQAFADHYPDFSLLFAWNHAEEIVAKEKSYLGTGGKFIVYVPEVQIIA